ncbi:MAG: phosphoglycerate kinase [Candidatus Ratteibacteria bacterium]|nr:phosphoglycerate kinase [Candidatus Ratteibacteria bacterium]
MLKNKLMFKIIASMTIHIFVFSTSASAYPTLGSLSKVERDLRVSNTKNNPEILEGIEGKLDVVRWTTGNPVNLKQWALDTETGEIYLRNNPKIRAEAGPDGKFVSRREVRSSEPDLFYNFELLNKIPSYEQLKGRMKGKNVLIKVNMNEPDPEKDAARLDMQKAIIDFVLKEGGTPILYGHGGRLDRDKDRETVLKDNRFSFETQAEYIQRLFPEKQVVFHKKSVRRCNIDKEEGLRIEKSDIQKGAVNIIENVRFGQGAETGSFREEFADQFAQLSDGILIFDAFGDVDSKGASVEDVPNSEYIKEVYLGPEMLKEFAAIREILEQGFDAMVTGGNKLEKLVKLEGAIKQSLNENGFVLLGSGLSEALDKNPEQLMKFQSIEGKEIIRSDYSDETHYDIGEKALEQFLAKLDSLKPGNRVVVNGTLGLMEGDEKYKEGTKRVYGKLDELADRGVKIIVVGGDATKAAKKYGLLKNGGVQSFSGGGVALTLLSGEVLKGVKAMANARERIALARKEEQMESLNMAIMTKVSEELQCLKDANEKNVTPPLRNIALMDANKLAEERKTLEEKKAALLEEIGMEKDTSELVAKGIEQLTGEVKVARRERILQVWSKVFPKAKMRFTNKAAAKNLKDEKNARAVIVDYRLLVKNPGIALAILEANRQFGQDKGLKFVLDIDDFEKEDALYRGIKKATYGLVDLKGQFDKVVSSKEQGFKEAIREIESRLNVSEIALLGPQQWVESFRSIQGYKQHIKVVCELGKEGELVQGDLALWVGLSNFLDDAGLLSDSEIGELQRVKKGNFYRILPIEIGGEILTVMKTYENVVTSE